MARAPCCGTAAAGWWSWSRRDSSWWRSLVECWLRLRHPGRRSTCPPESNTRLPPWSTHHKRSQWVATRPHRAAHRYSCWRLDGDDSQYVCRVLGIRVVTVLDVFFVILKFSLCVGCLASCATSPLMKYMKLSWVVVRRNQARVSLLDLPINNESRDPWRHSGVTVAQTKPTLDWTDCYTRITNKLVTDYRLHVRWTSLHTHTTTTPV